MDVNQCYQIERLLKKNHGDNIYGNANGSANKAAVYGETFRYLMRDDCRRDVTKNLAF
jgi:hypothetical protein